jgi:hypothetical protein
MNAVHKVADGAGTASQDVPIHVTGIDEARARPRADSDWLWDGYLAPRRLTLLTGQCKAGKTTLLSVLLSRMATGGTLAGRVVRPGRAVVVSEEDEEDWLERDERLHFGPNLGLMCRPFRGCRPSPDAWGALIDHLVDRRNREGLDLVAIDPLASFLPGRTENDAATVLEALLPLQRLTLAGTSVLVLHHPKKGPAVPGLAARGSSALGGHADIIVEMDWFARSTDDDRRRKLSGFSRRMQTPRRLVIELSADGTDYTAVGDYAAPEFDDGWRVMFWVLEDASHKLTRRRMLEAWPCDYPKPSEATLHRWLERAVKAGEILRTGTGRRDSPFQYWLDGMEEVWRSDPFYLEPLPPMEVGPGPRKTLAEVLAKRKGGGK